jgi:hypothetical protein
VTRVTLIDGNNLFRRTLAVKARAVRFLYQRSLHPLEPTIWVWDGEGAIMMRRRLYAGYKVNRQKHPPDPSVHAHMDLLRSVMPLSGCLSVRVPGFEADDVIAKIVQSHPDTDFFIETNDADLGQLVRPGITTVIAKLPAEPEWIRLYKACVGDPSDNIGGLKGFGQKGWEALSIADRMVLRDFAQSPSWYDIRPLINLPAKITNLLLDHDTWKNWQILYRIVGFIDVPDKLIQEHTITGRPNFPVVDKILKDILQ